MKRTERTKHRELEQKRKMWDETLTGVDPWVWRCGWFWGRLEDVRSRQSIATTYHAERWAAETGSGR